MNPSFPRRLPSHRIRQIRGRIIFARININMEKRWIFFLQIYVTAALGGGFSIVRINKWTRLDYIRVHITECNSNLTFGKRAIQLPSSFFHLLSSSPFRECFCEVKERLNKVKKRRAEKPHLCLGFISHFLKWIFSSSMRRIRQAVIYVMLKTDHTQI